MQFRWNEEDIVLIWKINRLNSIENDVGKCRKCN